MDALRVIIVGAGIGGLSAAIALDQAGYDVAVYERALEIRPVGAGLCMWPNGAKAMNALGLERTMREISPVMSAVRFHAQDGELLSDIPMQQLVESTGQRPYPVARADLQAALLDAFGPERVILGAECKGVEHGPEDATALFADGRRATGDLVIGADGIRSTVRQYVAGAATTRHLSWDWEGLTDTPLVDPDTFSFFVGSGKRAATMPVANGRFYFFFDFQKTPALDHLGMHDQLRAMFDGWCEPVKQLIESVSETAADNLNLRDLDPIDSFVRGRVALLGDAAHATTPFLGQGAAQAAEDALVLARYLRTTTVSVPDALGRYEAERRERVHAIVRGAREKGEAATIAGSEQNEQYYAELRAGSRDFVAAVEQFTITGPLR